MNEDTKMILEEMAKMKEEIMHEFAAVRREMQASHDELSKKIDDLQQVTGRNCYELTLLKAKQA